MTEPAIFTEEERRNAEQTWLTSNEPEDLLRGSLALLEEDRGLRFQRKLRLFGVACLRRIAPLFQDERSRQWIDILEQNADGVISDEEQDRLGPSIVDPPNPDCYQGVSSEPSQIASAWQTLRWASDPDLRAWDANAVARRARDAAYPDPGLFKPADERRVLHDRQEGAVQVALLRDIFGNPFQPVAVDASWLTWNNAAIVALAQAIHDERAFDRLPILADALEEAGCATRAILDHCRGLWPHCRGCWVVDLLLGKE